MLKYLHDSRPGALTELSFDKYRADLIADETKLKLAFEKAWDARKFEIELYWKRATYFWAFIATTFLGYFALVNSANYRIHDDAHHIEVYFLICIGFVLSSAWFFILKGSKAWQRHWEVHVDLLEDKMTGPLYKTVYSTKTYSVSKINEIVSLMFVVIWILLGIKFLFDQNLLNWNLQGLDIFASVSTAFAIVAVYAMHFGHGRGRFTDRSVRMYRRGVTYETKGTNPDNTHRNPVGWFEIYVQDMERAIAFYQKTFQVTLQPLPSPGMDMWAFPPMMQHENPGCGGALVKMDGKDSGVGGTIIYFWCEDCGVEASRVTPSGGQIHLEKMGIGEYGFISLVLDTEGNMIGLHSMQ